MYDALIVGSGPAGSAAALKLASNGARVAVIEKNKPPRYKTCGGGITYRARKLIGIDISDAVDAEFNAVQLNFLNSDLQFEAARDIPVISMVMRDQFDNLLMQYAVDAGTDLYTDTTFKSLSHHADHIEINTDKGTFKARFVIGADGAKSPVAKSIGWKDTRHMIPALECEVYTNERDMDKYKDVTRFDFDIIPQGYAWVFPKKDHLSIGLGSSIRGNVKLKNAYARYLDILEINNPVRDEIHGFVIPVSPRKDGFTRDRTILVGDSAGFADPVTAEGISFAVYSGQVAAQALLNTNFDQHKACAEYEELIANNLLPEIRAAKLLARILYTSPKLRNWLFRKYGQRFTEGVAKVFTGEDSYQQVMQRHLYFPVLFGFSSSKPGFVRL